MKCEREGFRMFPIHSIEVGVRGISTGRVEAVVEALHRAANWQIRPEGWWTEETALSIESDAMLRTGETGPEFAARLARTTWDANAGYCPVHVTVSRPTPSD